MKLLSAISLLALTSCSITSIGNLHAQNAFPTKLGMTIIQRKAPDIIIWSPENKLKWDDFQCSPDTTQKYFCASTVSIGSEWTCDAGKMQYDVRALFSRSRSWANALGKSDHVLLHEQHHFDLTEVYARMIRKQLALLAYFCEDQAKINEMIAELKKQHLEEQARYDIETNHARNRIEQKKWETEIDARLK